MLELSRQDLEDILYGCTIYGTGGGGELEEGFELIERALQAGKKFRLVGQDEVADDAMICTPYMLGAISEDIAAERRYASLPRSGRHPILLAFDRMSEHLSCEFYGTVACELGGANTGISFFVAAMNDLVILDADPAARAVPEITHSTYYLNQLPAAPIVAANQFGEHYLCENIIDDKRAEEVVRALSIVSGNDIAVVDHALPMETLRPALIHGAISRALLMGRTFRQAKAASLDIADSVAEVGKGFVAFRGTISDCNYRTEAGFTLGNIVLTGDGVFLDRVYKVLVKNENLVGWIDEQVHATIPDLICLLDMTSGEPITNPNYRVGMSVAVVILPAAKEFLTAEGLDAFGPRYVGIQQDYAPAKPI